MNGLFIGLSTIDLQFLVKAYPLENSKVKAHGNTISAGGPATNAAIVYNWLGGKATLCTLVGEHIMKEVIHEELNAHEIRLIDPISGQPSEPVYASIITAENSAHRTIYSYHPMGNNHSYQIPGNMYNQLFDTVLIDGFYLPLVKELLHNGIRYQQLILDGGSWKDGMEDILSEVDIAICSSHFFPPHCDTHEDVFAYLHSFGITEIMITRGDEPVLWHSEKRLKEIPVEKVDAVDTLGAGDFFHGAFCYFYTQTEDVYLAANQAARTAALSCKHFGTRSWLQAESPVDLQTLG